MIIPPYLQPGDTIAIVAPSGIISPETVAQAQEVIHQLGFKTILGKHLFHNHFRFSATDEQRAEDFQTMLAHPDVKAILCARGGYGAIRIIDRIDFKDFDKNPKWIIGFSDITIFHALLHNQLGCASLHAPMCNGLKNMDLDSPELNYWLEAISGQSIFYRWNGNPFDRTGFAEGQLIGGNLSILYALRGTKYDFHPQGKILFIEDLSEQYYHLDRILHNFRLGGKFDGLAGLIVGQMTEMKDGDPQFGQTIEEIVLHAVRDYDFPVAFGFDAGHDTPNFALRLGTDVQLDISGGGSSLSF